MQAKELESISATDLARNIAQTIDNVRINRTSILITKGSKVIAELSPPPTKGLSIPGLMDLLKLLPKLMPQDSLQMSKDIKKIRKNTKFPDNPWE